LQDRLATVVDKNNSTHRIVNAGVIPTPARDRRETSFRRDAVRAGVFGERVVAELVRRERGAPDFSRYTSSRSRRRIASPSLRISVMSSSEKQLGKNA
jgi:hypothetical protein